MISSPSSSNSNNNSINSNTNNQPRFLLDIENFCSDPLYIFFPNYSTFSSANDLLKYFNTHYVIKLLTEPQTNNNNTVKVCHTFSLSNNESSKISSCCGIHVRNVQQFKWDNDRKTKYAAIVDKNTNQVVQSGLVKFKTKSKKEKEPTPIVFPNNNLSSNNFLSVSVANASEKKKEPIDFYYNSIHSPLITNTTTSNSINSSSPKSNVLERTNEEVYNKNIDTVNNNVTNELLYNVTGISPLLQPLHQRVSPQKEIQQQFNLDFMNNNNSKSNNNNNYTSILTPSSSTSPQQYTPNITPSSCDVTFDNINFDISLDSISSFNGNNNINNIINPSTPTSFSHFLNEEFNNDVTRNNTNNINTKNTKNNNGEGEATKRTRGFGDDNYSSSSSLLSNKQHEKKNLKEDNNNQEEEEEEEFETELDSQQFLELFNDFKFKLESNVYDLIDSNYKKKYLLEGVTLCQNLLNEKDRGTREMSLEAKINEMDDIKLQYSLFGVVFTLIASVHTFNPMESALRSFKEDFLNSFVYSNRRMALQFKTLISTWFNHQLNCDSSNSNYFSLVFVTFVRDEMKFDISNHMISHYNGRFMDLLANYIRKSNCKEKLFNNDLNNNEMEEANNLLKRLTLDNNCNVTEKELQQFEKLSINYLKTKNYLQKLLSKKN
ncbi:hypothetical protein ABK040_004260 [Willaertia magna]